jgi:ATP-dependent DNA helicase RecQ
MPDNAASKFTNENIRSVLKKHFGFERFRPMQEDIILSVLAGKDVLALMPTGGGKSLCYQIPSLAKDGLCLVISPLIALMKDQVENLKRKNITAFAIYAGMSRKEVINTLEVAANSNCKFLYVSPERLETNLFQEYLPSLPINLIAVDEAHCISQWGYDFRPPYLRIAAIREQLAGIPILALTASATPAIQKDICEKLQFKNEKFYQQSFARPNLSYSVFKEEFPLLKAVDILQKVKGSSIVYCKSRRKTKEVADELRSRNIQADFYHAGLSAEERSTKQDNWKNNKTNVIVCTNAFGMGIDKPDVRTVIHIGIPECLENYYQEAGRAGRDGNKSYAVLLYDQKGLNELKENAEQKFPSLEEIKTVYQSIANYFQLPVGAGEGQYFDFDLIDFSKKFQLSPPIIVNSLKALEQDGWISFNEQVFIPTKAQFIASREHLFEIEKSDATLDHLCKTMLRTYEGIFDRLATINEKQLVSLAKIPLETIQEKLQLLHRMGVIEYQPQKDNPQLFFPVPRAKVEDVRIDILQYKHRKEQYEQRLQTMIDYATETAACRSTFIGNYFGDAALKPCGVCDNCLKQKNIKLSGEELEAISYRILNTIKYEPLTASELMKQLSGIDREKTLKIIDHLQAESKIFIGKDSKIRLT